MKTKILAITVAIILLLSSIVFTIPIIPTIAIPTEINVPADYLTIQEAVDAANPGDVIIVAPGTYEEQVVFNKSLMLQGESGARIVAPLVRNTYTIPESSATWDPIVFAFGGNESSGVVSGSGTINVTINGFEIDGWNKAGASARFAGVLYRNVNPGIITNNTIYNMFDADGKGNGPQTFGIVVFGDSDVEINDNHVSSFSRGGIVALVDAHTTIEDNTILGNGLETDTDWWAENGIQVDYGATGSIINNNISNCLVNDPYWSASGIIAWYNPIAVLNNTVTSCGIGVAIGEANCTVQGNAISDCIRDDFAIGIGLYDAFDTTIEKNIIEDNDYGIWIDGYSTDNIIQQNVIQNNGHDGIHIEPYGGFSPSGTLVLFNDIAGNGACGINKTGSGVVTAKFNWWGDVSGPYNSTTNPSGLGDAITSNVTYSPWLGSPYGTVPMTFCVNPTGTIQDGIDAANAGDTILVSSGTHAGAYVYKNVTIQGAAGGASTISPGVPYKDGSGLLTAFRVNGSASGAEIRGLTINCNASESYYFAVFSRNASSITIDSLTVKGSVQGITNWGGSDWEIINNILNGTEAAGGGGIGIFLGAYPPSYPECAGNLVQNNTIWSNATAPDYSTPGICLALDVRWGAYDSLTGNEDLSGNQIINNTIENLGYANGVGIEVGVIGVQGNTTQITNTLGYIHDNTVSSNLVDNSYLGVYFYVVTDLTVEFNEIRNCSTGIHIDDGLNGSRINYNNIYNNGVGINNTAGETVDAKFNWWWDASGPYHQTLNPDAEGDTVTDDVLFEHWLLAPYPPPLLSPTIYVDPAETELWTLSYGEEFSINVKIDNVTDLMAFDFKLYWDTDLLNLTSVLFSPPWSGSYMVLKNETDEASGLYWLAIGAFSSPTFNGSTTLATLTFMVTYDPIYPENRTCTFDLSETDLSAPSGVPIPHLASDGQYSIYATRPRIEVQPSSYSAHALGETFIVNVTINDVVNLYNFTFKLTYNTTMLDVLNMQLGSFLNSPVYQSTFVINDANGYVVLAAWSTGGAAPASGSGVLASITFQASLATMWTTENTNIISCSLHLQETALKTNLGVDIPHDTSDGTYYYEPKPGDLDYDGCVGLADLRIIAYYYKPAYDPMADVDEDSDVDIFDFTLVAARYGEC